jgi:hypothetical protein
MLQALISLDHLKETKEPCNTSGFVMASSQPFALEAPPLHLLSLTQISRQLADSSIRPTNSKSKFCGLKLEVKSYASMLLKMYNGITSRVLNSLSHIPPQLGQLLTNNNSRLLLQTTTLMT